MASEEKVLAAIDDAGRGLRVVFARGGDRWGHRIEVVNGEQATAVWESTEGSAHDDWPPSPALQDISVERLPDGRDVIFLVGKAGSSHWSASVEAATSPPHIIFDIACRHGGKVGKLGSEYQLLMLNPPCTIGKSDLASTQVEPGDSSIAISPTSVVSEKAQQTTRWKYEVELNLNR